MELVAFIFVVVIVALLELGGFNVAFVVAVLVSKAVVLPLEEADHLRDDKRPHHELHGVPDQNGQRVRRQVRIATVNGRDEGNSERNCKRRRGERYMQRMNRRGSRA